MEIFEKAEAIWHMMCEKTAPARKVGGDVGKKVWKVISTVWSYIYRLRGLLLTAPVLIGAVILACMNYTKLPETVGINLMTSGEFDYVVGRGTAVLVPLGLTVLCVVLTVCSKKTLYPWLVSIFSLALPLLIYVINVYPG